MKVGSSSISTCRHCQFYAPEGRRGGYCRKLNVAVQGRWNACSLATPPFARAWKDLESLTLWQQQTAMQGQALLVVEGSLSTDLFEDAPRSSVSLTSVQASAV